MATSTPSASLEDLSHCSVISHLGKLAESVECHFSCGGVISQVSSVVVDYKKLSGEWSTKPLQLTAGLADESIQEFLASCSTASFGIGSKTVVDKTYRDALALKPESFHTSFELANTSILSQVARIMSVGSSIRAEIYKLNVYLTGGHFKSHVDTPRSEDMFGSLVVCLPSYFKGGELLTRHQGRQVTFDWSAAPATYWAAFYSDVEHEVLPVTSGYRFTLTYNLYLTLAIEHTLLDVTTNPFYQALQAALRNPRFMRGGGILGFYCQYKYVGINTDLDKFSPHLKGEDAIVFEVAKSLGLSVALRPILSGQHWEDKPKPIEHLVCEDDNNESEEDGNYVLLTFESHRHRDNLGFGHEDGWGWREHEFITTTYDGIEKIDGISWCQNPALFEPIMSALAYGNDASLKAYYQSAAFLVTVPKFSAQRGYTLTTPDSDIDCPPAKQVKIT